MPADSAIAKARVYRELGAAGINFFSYDGMTHEGRTEAYLAKVAAINIETIRRLASAPAAPDGVTVAGALSRDTTVRWQPVAGAVKYRVHWRRADTQNWSMSRDIAGATEVMLKNVPIDDNFVGVSAIAGDGSESLVTFAGPARRKN